MRANLRRHCDRICPDADLVRGYCARQMAHDFPGRTPSRLYGMRAVGHRGGEGVAMRKDDRVEMRGQHRPRSSGVRRESSATKREAKPPQPQAAALAAQAALGAAIVDSVKGSRHTYAPGMGRRRGALLQPWQDEFVRVSSASTLKADVGPGDWRAVLLQSAAERGWRRFEDEAWDAEWNEANRRPVSAQDGPYETAAQWRAEHVELLALGQRQSPSVLAAWSHLLEAFAYGLWCFWPIRGCIVALTRPMLSADAAGRLHSADRPAVVWPNGRRQWFLRGIPLPSNILSAQGAFAWRQHFSDGL